MGQLLSTSWGRNVVSALLGAILFVLVGILVGAPPAITVAAAVIFGALLVLIVQLGLVIAVLWSSRRNPPDLGETMVAETETPEGQQELKRMSFSSLLTVAVVQELYVTLFKRDRPLWALEFFGVGEGQFAPKSYGTFNRYLEWMLIIGLGVFTFFGALLLAYLVNAGTSTRASSATGALLCCAAPAFLIGLLLVLPVGLFVTSVIRRMWILYATRTDESQIK